MTSLSSLQEQIDQLKQELEAKDDTLFEVSATLAAIQVETQHRVHQVETDAALRIRKSDESSIASEIARSRSRRNCCF